jgi:hypothetical protein
MSDNEWNASVIKDILFARKPNKSLEINRIKFDTMDIHPWAMPIFPLYLKDSGFSPLGTYFLMI